MAAVEKHKNRITDLINWDMRASILWLARPNIWTCITTIEKLFNKLFIQILEASSTYRLTNKTIITLYDSHLHNEQIPQ